MRFLAKITEDGSVSSGKGGLVAQSVEAARIKWIEEGKIDAGRRFSSLLLSDFLRFIYRRDGYYILLREEIVLKLSSGIGTYVSTFARLKSIVSEKAGRQAGGYSIYNSSNIKDDLANFLNRQ